MKDFLDLCNKEKEIDKQRNIKFKEAKTEMDKKRLEKIIAMQRAQSADKVGEFNKKIDEKLKKYEDQLKQMYEQQKNKGKKNA